MAKGKKSVTKTLVWVLLAVLMLGLGGLGVTNFSSSLSSVATVGDEKITTNDYARALDNQLRQLQSQLGTGLTFQQAQSFGLPQQVLGQQVQAAAMRNEASRVGLSVGDEQLARALRDIPSFQGADGQFDRETYGYVLRNAGMTEAEFEADMRADQASNMLQGAVMANITTSQSYIDTVVGFIAERRDLTWAEVSPERLTGTLPEPQGDELQAFYDENIDAYTRPRTKDVTYVWLTPDMIVDTVEVDEATLRAAYDERFDEFNLPARRLVERLAFANSEAAETALAEITAGESTFDQLVEARGLSLMDADLGDVTEAELGDAGAAVFAAEVGDVIVAPSDLGPALYRINGELGAQETTFEDAVPDLRGALALDRAGRVIEAQATEFDDELAAGATLEDLAEMSDLQIDTLEWAGGSDADIAGYPAFRNAVQAITVDDYPEITTLGDGGLFSLRLDGVREPAPYPFAQVRDQVMQDWLDTQELSALRAEAETLAAQLADGAGFLELGLTANSETGLIREDRMPDLPAEVISAAFELEPGEFREVEGDGRALIVQLDAISEPDFDSPEVANLVTQLRNGAANDIANGLLGALSADVQQRAGVSLDQTAIDAVHAQMQ